MEQTNANRMIREIKRLKKRSETFSEKESKANEKILLLEAKLFEGSPISEVTEDAIRMRKKALGDPTIKLIMETYGISLEDIALIEDQGERVRNFGYLGDQEYTLTPKSNVCETYRSYIFGGPQSALKIMFRNCNNGRYVLTGFQFKFPEKKKNNWKGFLERRQPNSQTPSKRVLNNTKTGVKMGQKGDIFKGQWSDIRRRR